MRELTPYTHLDALLTVAADTLRDVADKSADLADDDEVNALLTKVTTDVAPALLQVNAELIALLEDRPVTP